MFKFDFDIEDEEDNLPKLDSPKQADQVPQAHDVDERPLVEHKLVEMLERLPSDISYSSVQLGDLCIPRRDLFDVRMQLIASDEEEQNKANQAIDFISRPSDLVPRVYEGGLKTWECSLDLAEYVVGSWSGIGALQGKRTVELGCGTAMPTLSVIQQLLNQPPPGDSDRKTIIHVQDYNASVLEYVTLPNIILVWFFSKAGESFRATLPPPSPKQPTKPLLDISNLTLDSVPEEEEDEEVPSNPPVSTRPDVESYDPTIPGDLGFSPALRSAFLASLKEYKIEIRFFSGPWDKFDTHSTLPDANSYDLILTSETIYQPTSLPSLVRLLRGATGAGDQSVCLVAAKLVYFGVGGGIEEFERALGEDGVKGRKESVWEHREGVGRSILRVRFEE
ncbi:hypothetical protein FRC08_002467 [Ceratobasidium sp. 394]|nr:hypothetical protein FRC08_002467 [Ceratobasidium sp. 394]